MSELGEGGCDVRSRHKKFPLSAKYILLEIGQELWTTQLSILVITIINFSPSTQNQNINKKLCPLEVFRKLFYDYGKRLVFRQNICGYKLMKCSGACFCWLEAW